MGKRWIVAVLVAVPLVFVAGLLYLLFHPQLTLTLEDVMNAEYDARDITTEVEEITAAVCGVHVECVEACSTAEANYYRFRTHAGATEYMSSLEDGFSVNYFVMDFAGKNAPVQDQLFAMQVLAGMWNDYEGNFPNRG